MAELPKPPQRVRLHYNAAGDFMFEDDSGRTVFCGVSSFGENVEAVYVLERVLTPEEKRATAGRLTPPSREDTRP